MQTKMGTSAPEMAIGCVVWHAMGKSVKTATKYCSTTLTIKATKRQSSKTKTEIVVTIGRPNYKERAFIKLAQKAGERFPIRKIQLKYEKQNKGGSVSRS